MDWNMIESLLLLAVGDGAILLMLVVFYLVRG